MTELPTFAAFFEAVHGFAPFPWQACLAEEVLSRGWPDLLDLPTGVGKTSALDVALYTLAAAPDRMPRRTLLVVDRRIVVDQGADHAHRILRSLRRRSVNPAAAAISDRLRALWDAGDDEAPFAVAVLRGGMPRDNDWARRPDQPVLGVSTVDQVGSRLLFRGYGIGVRSVSIHAGLIGNDTLILLDEVHLAMPFAETLEAVQKRFRRPPPDLPDRFAIVRMSATPGPTSSATRVFALAGDDRRHPILSRRLSAKKPARLVLVKVRGDDEGEKRAVLARAAVSAALELQGNGAPVVAVVVNRVDTARLVRRRLAAEHAEATDVVLVTGRMRPIDRDRVVRDELLPRAGAGRIRTTGLRPLVVVATQCIEAGADLDFDGLVTECASLDALRQRFGRLDRRGERQESAAVILARSDDVVDGADDPVYGTAMAATWTWLHASATDGVVDFGVDALPPPLDGEGQLRGELLARVAHSPVLLPAHLDAWAQTSPLPSPDPNVSLWLHGPERDAAEVQIVWRADINDERSREDCTAQLSACRPSTLEAVTVPLAAARAWLQGRTVPIADVVAVVAPDELRARQEEVSKSAFRWTGDDSDWIDSTKLRPGDVLVVPATRGGLGAGSFDPDEPIPVADVADLAQLRGRGIASLRLNPKTLTCWGLGSELEKATPLPTDDESPVEARERIKEWIDLWPIESPPGFCGTSGEWRAAGAAFAHFKRRPILVTGHYVVMTPVARKALGRDVEVEDVVSEDDDSSFRQQEVTLHKHSADVRDFAESFARAIGFSPAIVADVARAGWLHDVGKADPRFQRWLLGGSEVKAALLKEPLAKSSLPAGNARERDLARQRAGYPKGYRHELLSLAMIQHEAALEGAGDKDLILHLVASHHGWCRPFAPSVDHPDDISVGLDHQGTALSSSTRHRLARLDSGVSDRFWGLVDRYGWWGLAWLEAVVRLADHRASEMEAGNAE